MLGLQTRRHSLIALSLTLVLLAIVGVLYLSADVAVEEEITYWPPLTMIYETDGPVLNGPVIRQTRRLEYRTATDWTDTVIESDPIQSLALGTVSAEGSYERMKGELVEEYDSITDDVTTETVEEGTLFIPNAYLVPYHNFVEDPTIAPDGTPYAAAVTSARVCYRSKCEENVVGLAFQRGAGTEWVLLEGERWGIVLRAGDAFVVRELTLDASKD